MTVSTTTSVAVFPGNDVATTFDYSFLVLEVAHLLVQRRVNATGVIDKTYSNSEYNVTGLGTPAGSVELIAGALSSDYTLVVTRVVPYTQELDIVNEGGFLPETVEQQLDKLEMQIQQVKDKADRAVRVPLGQTLDDVIGWDNGEFLVKDASGNVTGSAGTGADSALRTDLAAAGGASLVANLGAVISAAALITTALGSATTPAYAFQTDTNTGIYSIEADALGVTAGGTAIAAFTPTAVGFGAVTPANLLARVTIQTNTAFAENAVHIYHYAQQTDPDNQTSALTIHNYTDGVAFTLDNVGGKAALVIRAAHNYSARQDKPADYVATGPFISFQRAKIDGLGVYPNGNLGTDNDQMILITNAGNITTYGSNGADWDGTDTLAPIQIGTYTNFLNQKLYLGYRTDINAAVIAAVDNTAGVYKQIFFGASALVPLGDAGSANPTSIGAQSLRYSGIYAVNVHPGAGTTTWTSGSGSPVGAIVGNAGDLYTDTAGGTSTTLYVKEGAANDGTVNGWVAK